MCIPVCVLRVPACMRATARAGFDSDPLAIDTANDNAAMNGASNVSYICADLSNPTAFIDKLGIRDGDVVIVDPPRPGLHPDFLALLTRVRACVR